tara:strand:+ start:90 stop:431 length:342 start_codon:yes stop_codon:yes gene_type:complete
MFQKTYKFIGIFIILLVLVGHHSFQAEAMEAPSHHNQEISCIGHDCHHQAEMEICEKLQGDEIQIVTEFVVLLENSHCDFIHTSETNTVPNEVYEKYRQRIPLSQKQLARPHL